MKLATPILAATLLWALPTEALAGPTHKGVSRGRSASGRLAACEAAKARANVSHCGPAVVAEKAVGACACSPDVEGWTCRVQWVEMCQDRHPAKSSRAATSTHRGVSKLSRTDACFAAEVEARRHACPGNTLDRDVSACICEVRGRTTTCIVDQILWCHR